MIENFTYNEGLIRDCWKAFNSRHKINFQKSHITSVPRELNGRNIMKSSFPSGDKVCAALERVDNTMQYLSTIKLGPIAGQRAAFNFYDLINNIDVVIESIRSLLKIYSVDDICREMETSSTLFQKAGIDGKGSDLEYFKYIRSIATAHPVETSRHPRYHQLFKFVSSPYTLWSANLNGGGNPNEIEVFIYDSLDKDIEIINLNVQDFINFLLLWYAKLENVVAGIDQYNEQESGKLRSNILKSTEGFDNYTDYLRYMSKEMEVREDYGNEYIIDEFILAFETRITDKENESLLLLYQNAIKYAMKFRQIKLQELTAEDDSNNGIDFPEKNTTSELFFEVHRPYCDEVLKHAYELEKSISLVGKGDESDRWYARRQLEQIKDWINQFVRFSNNESDQETLLLVDLARYLCCLNNNCVLNWNIPNTEEFRLHVYPEAEFQRLIDNRYVK